MIVEQNVTMIVSTCKLEENGKAKCNKFWPSGQPGATSSFNISQDPAAPKQVEVSLLEDVAESAYLRRREMSAKVQDGTHIQNVT